jgi:cytochrome b involved in lipid metabolism
MSALRQISTAELATANSPQKGWVAIRGQVYDLTKFMERHPGGWNIILAAVGRDCTIAFETSHDEKAVRTLQYVRVIFYCH